MRFGVSTHLYHDQKLSREHLAQMASYGFDTAELFATRTHFDYQDPAAVTRLGQWLRETGLTLHSVHAPVAEGYAGGAFEGPFSLAASDNAKRLVAMKAAEGALAIAKEIPFKFMVLHLGTPSRKAAAGDNSRAAGARSLEELCRAAEPLGVRVAVEVIPNDLSSAPALVTMLERDFDDADVGICMDFGHAHLMGDVPDAIETAAEHLVTTHIHDNRRRDDDHLVPYQGTIDWASALVTMRKIGYDGTYLMELSAKGTPSAVLEEARRARQRMERALAD